MNNIYLSILFRIMLHVLLIYSHTYTHTYAIRRYIRWTLTDRLFDTKTSLVYVYARMVYAVYAHKHEKNINVYPRNIIPYDRKVYIVLQQQWGGVFHSRISIKQNKRATVFSPYGFPNRLTECKRIRLVSICADYPSAIRVFFFIYI